MPVLRSHAQHPDDRDPAAIRGQDKIVYKDYPLSRYIPGRNTLPTTPIAWPRKVARLTGSWRTICMPISARSADRSRMRKRRSTSWIGVTLDFGKKNGADSTQLQACVKAQADSIVKASMAEGDTAGRQRDPDHVRQRGTLEGALDADEVRAALNRQLLAAGVQPPPAPAKPAPPAQVKPAIRPRPANSSAGNQSI